MFTSGDGGDDGEGSDSVLRLNQSEMKRLLAQPETGMGYQVVEVVLEDNRKETGIAYNAEFLTLREQTQNYLRRLRDTTFSERSNGSRTGIKSLTVVTRGQSSSRFMRTKRVAGAAGASAPADDAPVETTKYGDVFKRFSAYENDRRLSPDGSWRDGTYATTEEDAKNVDTGKDAVSRYALPNPKPASYRFTARPHVGTEIQVGTVAPAHGQPGGGVEVLFRNGTQQNTVTGPKKIPDE